MGHACSSVICTLKLSLVLGVCPAVARGLALKQLAAGISLGAQHNRCFQTACRASSKPFILAFDLGSGRDTR